MSRTIRLVERRPRAVRLPRPEVEFLLGPARSLIDLAPTFEPGAYTLTPRGHVGFLTGPTARYTIRPKVPWPNLLFLLGLADAPGGEAPPVAGGLLAAVATAFADRLEGVAKAGLVAGYGEVESVSPFLRGRLRAAAQMRDAAARAFPGHFHIDEPVFDLDTPWNRVAKAAANLLLAHPGLPRPLRERVEFALRPLASVSDVTPSDDLLTAALAEPRAAGYRPLLDVCRIILHGFRGFDPAARTPGAFLIDLGQAFERYLAAALARALATRPGWSVEAHPPFAVGPTVLQPDTLVRRNGEPRAVLDAKWKPPALDAADLHQVLAYAAVTGARRVGLVYPGRTDRRASFTAPGGVTVTRYRVRVVGTAAELARSVERLARHVRRR